MPKKSRNPASDWAWHHNTCRGNVRHSQMVIANVLASPTVTDEAKILARQIRMDLSRLSELMKERQPFNG